VAAFEQALHLAPGMVEVRVLLADALHTVGRIHEARSAYRAVLESHPQDPLVLMQLGQALRKLGSHEEALLAYRQAQVLLPEDGGPLHGLGSVLHSLDRHEEAIEAYGQALEWLQESPELHYDLGLSLHQLGRLDESIAALQRAIAFRPDYANAHWDLSLALLAGGNFSEGWKEYEWRWSSDHHRSPQLPTTRPVWEGAETANGLLLWQEQGIGDTVMFLSLLQEISTHADPVIVQADRRLLPVLQRSFTPVPSAERDTLRLIQGRVEFSERSIPVGEDRYAHHLPLGSLPGHLRPSAQDFTRQPKRYLRADPLRSRSLRERLRRGGRLTCGISWRSSNPMIGNRKSLPLAALAAALARPEVRLVSLQYGDVATEIAALRQERGIEVTVEPSVDNFRDIDGLASLIEACDLVISISCTTVHLAGALGKPTWVLLSDVPDWRWGLTGDSSLWYPSLRLFRQQRRGDWSTVLQQLRGSLEELLGTSPRLFPLFDV
jgi:tetratricopeptide (TPR) repeat protein